MRQNKWKYVWVIQYKSRYGWEDVSEYEQNERRDALRDLQEYRISGGVYGLIGRRVKAYGD